MGEDISLVIGVDEAGRGPLVGDMVIALVVFRECDLGSLARLGVKDSKSLTPVIRRKLLPYILRYSLATIISHVSPLEIDTKNLNELTINRISYLLGSLKGLIDPYIVKRITIDMVTGYRKYSTDYREHYPYAEVIFEANADVKYVEVSAASIVAKCYRDQLIEEVNRVYGELGSGYPIDRRTIEWIRRVYGAGEPPPPFLRRSWSILKKIAPEWYVEKKRLEKEVRQRSLMDFMG